MLADPEDGRAFCQSTLLTFWYSYQHEHLDYLKKVTRKAFLKLKCMFVREGMEHLGHVRTMQGVKTNHCITEAMQDFLDLEISMKS